MKRGPDEKDELLMSRLAEDSRMPLKTLAGEVGLSTSATQERIARLRRDGLILGFTIRRARKESHVSAHMWITTEAQTCAQLAPNLRNIPEIEFADSVSGTTDLAMRLSASSTDRIQQIRDTIAAMEGVTDVQTAVVLERRIDRTV